MKKRPFLARVPDAYRRRMARWFGRRLYALPAAQPLVSFTFDDFPRSAGRVGAEILERAGAAGTYYTSRGLAGQTAPTGEIFLPDDLPLLLQQGHELGCHTFHHYPAWATATNTYISSIKQNAAALAGVLGSQPMATHSYPISYPRPATKRGIQGMFRACRGGGQTFNSGSVDLNYLSSFFLEQSRDDFAAVERVIVANAGAAGWLVFSTHDVTASPTRFGCTPDFFERVVRSVVQSGAKILPMSAALDAVGVPPCRPYSSS